MIHAVWRDIVALQGHGDAAALRAFVQRQTKTSTNPAGITSPEFLTGDAANSVLEGLKGWRARLRRSAA